MGEQRATVKTGQSSIFLRSIGFLLLGLQYRLSISTRHKPWINSSDKVYGYHIFLDGQIKKGFFGRLQYEDLSTQVPRLDVATGVESTSQEWVTGLLLGIGKTYTFY